MTEALTPQQLPGSQSGLAIAQYQVRNAPEALSGTREPTGDAAIAASLVCCGTFSTMTEALTPQQLPGPQSGLAIAQYQAPQHAGGIASPRETLLPWWPVCCETFSTMIETLTPQQLPGPQSGLAIAQYQVRNTAGGIASPRETLPPLRPRSAARLFR